MTTELLDNLTAAAATETAMEVAPPRDIAVMPGFSSNSSWELAQRIGKAFAASTLVPAAYQGNLANCIVALEMANRMRASPLMVMQSLYIVHGTPSWSAKFLIATFNQCGRFSALRYEWTPDKTGCRAWAIERATGDRIDGPQVTLAMAKDEGWSTKPGSKWKTMPELMMMYRAAAFLIRTYAPEISMGLQTDDEIVDAAPVVHQTAPRVARAEEVGALLGAPKAPEPPAGDAAPKFDEAAFARRLQACTDPSLLDLEADTIRDVADEDARTRLTEVYEARRRAIGGGK